MAVSGTGRVPLLFIGNDSDNRSELSNHHLCRYDLATKIFFTRLCPLHKTAGARVGPRIPGVDGDFPSWKLVPIPVR